MQLTQNTQDLIIACADAACRELALADTYGLAGMKDQQAFCLYNAEAESAFAFFLAGDRSDWSRQEFLPLTYRAAA